MAKGSFNIYTGGWYVWRYLCVLPKMLWSPTYQMKNFTFPSQILCSCTQILCIPSNIEIQSYFPSFLKISLRYPQNSSIPPGVNIDWSLSFKFLLISHVHKLSLSLRVLSANDQSFLFFLQNSNFIILGFCSIKNAFKWVQTSLVLVQWFLRYSSTNFERILSNF